MEVLINIINYTKPLLQYFPALQSIFVLFYKQISSKKLAANNEYADIIAAYIATDKTILPEEFTNLPKKIANHYQVSLKDFFLPSRILDMAYCRYWANTSIPQNIKTQFDIKYQLKKNEFESKMFKQKPPHKYAGFIRETIYTFVFWFIILIGDILIQGGQLSWQLLGILIAFVVIISIGSNIIVNLVCRVITKDNHS